MSPKEKALQLYNRMVVDFKIDKWQSQQCALVAVDEIIETLGSNKEWELPYWKQVKEEIEKL